MKATDFTSTGKYFSIVVKVAQDFFPKLRDQIEFTLANCDMLCFILAVINGLPYPAKYMKNANLLHTEVTNGWEAIPYVDGMILLPNDIVEWSINHVAYVYGTGKDPAVYASWWTNYNGTSGKPNRDMTKTKTIAETVDYFYKNYPKRFFRDTTFKQECSAGAKGTLPSYVIRYKPNRPNPVKEDTSKNQLLVSTAKLNLREQPYTTSASFGYIKEGYYDVTQVIEKKNSRDKDYDWYQLGNYWVAGVPETKYIQKKEANDYKSLYEEAIVKLTILEDKLNKIKEIL